MVHTAPETAVIQYGKDFFSYQIIRQRGIEGKITIHFHPNGSLMVEAPIQAEKTAIQKAVLKRARWIHKRLLELKKMKTHAIPRQYISGETHFYLGRRYTLKVLEERQASPSTKLLGNSIVVTIPEVDKIKVQACLDEWYRHHAQTYFQSKLETLSLSISWLKTTPPLRLQKMKSQWGSCSPKGVILLNPSLIKAPRDCIAYVILHELCHLKEHNHSTRFYDLLAREMPGWKAVKTKLDSMVEILITE
jgi:predicted metal-dependent hydrolase